MENIRKPLKEKENLNISYDEITKVLQREILLQKKREWGKYDYRLIFFKEKNEWDKYSDELLLMMKKRKKKNKHLIQMLKELKQNQDVYFNNLINNF